MSAKIVFITGKQHPVCRAEGKVFSEWLAAPLLNSIKRAGLLPEMYTFIIAAEYDVKGYLLEHKPNVVVPLGEDMLELVTGLTGIGKWHTSVVPSTAELGYLKCIPMYHPEYIQTMYHDHFFYVIGCQKLRQECQFSQIMTPQRQFMLNPPLEDALQVIRQLHTAPAISIDWEFGRGQLNTLGFAWSATEAMAIKCLPGEYSTTDYHRLFAAIKELLESPVPKVVQHAIVEVTWMARYGIEVRNVVWDTMWAMKYLHPEFDKGLDNVGRVYTPYPYWKDDNDDWTNIRDWQKHLEYNCKDTTGTYAAWENQQEALRARGRLEHFTNFVMRFQPVIQEMCTTGLRVDDKAFAGIREKLAREHENFQRIIDDECTKALGKTINVRSPKQLKEALQAMGMKLPTKRVQGKADAQETTDKKALVKLKRQYPDASILPALIGISATNKRLSSYVDFRYDKQLGRVHYTLDGCGTESGRWASYMSSWGTGFNAQTIPKAVRSCFTADPDTVLVQIDLKQAESRYVAWEAPDPKLMELIEAGRDIHRYVAGKIFNKPEEIVNDFERQLGKKAGHASNYGTGPRTFAEACLVEMNHYLEEKEARRVLEAYFTAFPGIRRRQENIRKTVYEKRCLRTPLGRERHFWGRMDDATFREAYSYCPQSAIPDITNHLMLKLWDNREYLGLGWDDGGRFLLQVHDSLLLQTRPERVPDIAEFCRDIKAWHPNIKLAGGELWIPTDVEAGPNWKQLQKV